MRVRPHHATAKKWQAVRDFEEGVKSLAEVQGVINTVGHRTNLSKVDITTFCKVKTIRVLEVLMIICERAVREPRYSREAVSAATLLLAYGHGKPVEQTINLSAQIQPADIARIVEQRRKESGRESMLDVGITPTALPAQAQSSAASDK